MQTPTGGMKGKSVNDATMNGLVCSTIGMISEHPPDQTLVNPCGMPCMACTGKGNSRVTTENCNSEVESIEAGETSVSQEPEDSQHIAGMIERLDNKVQLNVKIGFASFNMELANNSRH